MKNILFASAAILALCATGANAAPINPGQTQTGVVVSGQASVYDVFGHPGNPGGGGGNLPAVLTSFTAAPGLVFNFTATGMVSCCSDAPNIPADGGGSGMSVGGTNGLSSLSGNTNVPLVGVFTSETDPFGGVAPAALSFDGANPLSLSPLLNQVFYIGDGHAGYNNLAGALLDFYAPTGATRLYLGAIDALGFNAPSGYYADNNGQFLVDITLSQLRQPPGPNGVPEPLTLSLFGAGLVGAAALRRKNASR